MNVRSRQRQTAIKPKVLAEADVVTEYPFIEVAKVGRVVGVGVTKMLTKGTGEHAHLVEQIDGAKW